MSGAEWPERAARLLGELMPVSVAVAGEGREAAVAALRAAGADAAEVGPGGLSDGPDLALLLADPGTAARPAMQALVQTLTGATDRILFVPSGGGGLADITAWFELFAERGFQPVLDFDAGFLGAGAFLVDRNAVAAETELAEFADRLRPEVPAFEPPRGPVATPDPGQAEVLAALRGDLAARDAALAAAETALAEARGQLEAWAPLRRWVEARVRAPAARRRFMAIFGRRRRAAVADAAAVRAAELFDPAWYIASHPELAAEGGDPVAHYLRHAATADPGPWFDTAAYLRDNPDADPARCAPLLHALRRGR